MSNTGNKQITNGKGMPARVPSKVNKGGHKPGHKAGTEYKGQACPSIMASHKLGITIQGSSEWGPRLQCVCNAHSTHKGWGKNCLGGMGKVRGPRWVIAKGVGVGNTGKAMLLHGGRCTAYMGDGGCGSCWGKEPELRDPVPRRHGAVPGWAQVPKGGAQTGARTTGLQCKGMECGKLMGGACKVVGKEWG